ncbi:unnamed protein product [Scytosiphon promiscuus]
MVNFSEETPFLHDEGGRDSKAICCTHERGLDLLKTIIQIDAVLAGFLVVALVGNDYERVVTPGEKVQIILQAVTFSVFLAAIAHTILLMVCTGWRYTLTWYDPLFPTAFSALGGVLLYITIADAILIRLPASEDVDTVGYWVIVVFGLYLPMALAGPMVTVQMVLHKFSSVSVRSETTGTGREGI